MLLTVTSMQSGRQVTPSRVTVIADPGVTFSVKAAVGESQAENAMTAAPVLGPGVSTQPSKPLHPAPV
jgi:hypothetical protein